MDVFLSWRDSSAFTSAAFGDLQAGEVAQRSDARKEEIGAALYGHEAFQIVYTRAQRIGLDREYRIALGVAVVRVCRSTFGLAYVSD